jgi:hypothetical protein
MGRGDDIIATGLARGPSKRGKRAAFGDGRKIVWGPFSEIVFRHNPNVARPGEEQCSDLEWVAHYKGSRIYNKLTGSKWLWNYDFKVIPGQFFFDAAERSFRDKVDDGFVLVEPNLEWHKSVSANKDWGHQKYQALTDLLLKDGYNVIQFSYGKNRLRGVKTLQTPTFRHAMAALSKARFAVLPEGGMHHGAGALGIRAVVLFGGFPSPQVTGYDIHRNLTGGVEACGSILACPHCKAAMANISVDEVYAAAVGL